MKVQRIQVNNSYAYIVIDDDYKPVTAVNKYLKYLYNIGKSPNTLRTYAYDLLSYLRFLKEKNIDLMDICCKPDCGPIDILSEFVIWLQYPDYSRGICHIEKESSALCNKTVNHIMSIVLELYRYLASNGEMQQLEVYRLQMNNSKFKPFLYEMVKHKTEVMSSIFKKPVISEPVRAITREEFDRLFNACNNRRDKLLVSMLFEGGLRLNEALGMHISDLEIENNIVHIVARKNNENGARDKRNAVGAIYLPDYVVDLLLDYINDDILEYDSDFLFLNLYNRGSGKGNPLKDASVEQLFLRLSKKLGFKVTPHMLRHGFAQEKLEAGWQLEQVQAYLRHKNATSTELYAQFTDALKINKMEEFIHIHDYTKEAACLGKDYKHSS